MTYKKITEKFNYLNKTFLTKTQVRGNCENFVGATQIPLGLAGPLKIKLQDTKKEIIRFIPLATTEGALVASVNRGCKATRLSGGVRTQVELVGTTRGPVFEIDNLEQGRKLAQWLKENSKLIKKEVEKNERHLHLLKIKTQRLGRAVYLRLFFDTEEAMGMNMVTIASDNLARLIKKRLKINCLSLSANFCIDKKPSWLNFIEGRGKKVWAEAVLEGKVIREVLKTKPEKIFKVHRLKNLQGSALAGSLGFNAHFANVVVALFLACGQDPAHVVEGSQGITECELLDKDQLYFSLFMPSLMVGTVGGGTKLACQKEALAILGLGKATKGEALTFAQIAAAAVLCGEISLLAALAAGHLSQAHERLGR